MTNGGGCERAEFVDNSRTVIEGQVLDTLQRPIANKTIFYHNGIQSSETKTKTDGSFFLSLPGTTDPCVLEAGQEIISFESNNSLRVIYPNRLVIDNSISYAKVKLIIK